MKLTDEEIKATKASIEHWQQIVDRLGKEAINELRLNLFWESGDEVKCYAEDCPLCEMFYKVKFVPHCIDCPYIRLYGFACCGCSGHWNKFVDDPNLETATAMLDALKKILEEE
jgi:hypothetical protein